MYQEVAMATEELEGMVGGAEWPLWEALVSQAKANQELSHVLLCQTQRIAAREYAIDMVPDRFDLWQAAEYDAVVGNSIA